MSMYEQWYNDIPAQFQGQERLNSLMEAFSTQLDEVYQMFDDLETKTTLDGAEGVQLDRIGEIVNINRQEALQLLNATSVESVTDKVYRAVLYFKILKNNTDCGYEDIMKGLHYLWDQEKAVLTYAENPQDDLWVNGYNVEFVTTLPQLPDVTKVYFLSGSVSHEFDRYVYTDGEWENTGTTLLTSEQETAMRNKTTGRISPATIELGILDIPSDVIDPMEVEPMVIKAGGIKILFKTSYRDEMDPFAWERFTNIRFAYEESNYWNGAHDFDGEIEWHSRNGTYEYNNSFDDSYQWNGAIYWGPVMDGMEVIDMDAVFLRQARRKTIRLRALGGDENWKIKYMVWGNGLAQNGRPYTPEYEQEELRNEVLRKEIGYHYQDGADTITYVGYIDEDELVNQYVSEVGLADSDGMIVCIKTFDKKYHNANKKMMFSIDDTIVVEEE